MQWSDEALVLGARRHGEAAVILELMTRAHGRHLGLVHGVRSKRLSPVLQPGNSVEAVWREPEGIRLCFWFSPQHASQHER